jgi:deoxyribodipyrimidine photo-lyase
MISPTINIFWFRRDLRLDDNAGLFHALQSGQTVLPLFIFDTNILGALADKQDARVTFIHNALAELNEQLRTYNSGLLVRVGTPQEVWAQLLGTYRINAVYTNRDYEPYALARDALVEKMLAQAGVAFRTFKDHVIFEKGEVLKDDGTPYTVFTPYSKRWLNKLQASPSSNLPDFDASARFPKFYKEKFDLIDLQSIGFEKSDLSFPAKALDDHLLANYDKTRDYPALAGTSRLGPHLRFGTLSIRQLARRAFGMNATFLNELIWRDFYSMILAHYPWVMGAPFKSRYAFIAWRNDPEDFRKWCEGKTGYPLVDAGMRELNATGFMHNRCRMVAASFLTKHLLIDWRWGEAYFAEKLLDYDLASNNGGWQWAAGCGTDAAPYFRIFNPTAQQLKFDKNNEYVKFWVPELGTSNCPLPMVPHELARKRCLEAYKAALE